ncbi:hypothetical protein M9Y10_005578 [Tritrichomonas musculus]|uniref:Pre-mRNA-splicing factor CWC24 n=1 Tax=Tritrichomonas musculus TaxID=1915356 RepID=A0ABR2JC51_9EUKA
MRKRTKTDNSTKVVSELIAQTETEKTSIKPIASINKPKSVLGSNEISAVSDSLSKVKKRQEKDIKLIHKKNQEGLEDGTIDRDDDHLGWKKMEFTVDQEMPICKDYHDTGYCTFGGACKYLHTRDDVVSSSQMEEQAGWKAFHEGCERAEAERRRKKVVTLEPDVCQICHKLLKDPVMVKCGHKFCSSCAIKRYSTDPTCAICGTDTEGIFNSVQVE